MTINNEKDVEVDIEIIKRTLAAHNIHAYYCPITTAKLSNLMVYIPPENCTCWVENK